MYSYNMYTSTTAGCTDMVFVQRVDMKQVHKGRGRNEEGVSQASLKHAVLRGLVFCKVGESFGSAVSL